MFESHRSRMMLTIGVVFVVILNLWMLNRPPHTTAIEWLLVGRDLPLGKIPYRDFFIHVGPLPGCILALFFWIFSPSVLVASLVFLGVNFATAFGLIKLSGLWFEKKLAIAAAAIYLCAVPFFGGSEMFVEPMVACAGVWAFYAIHRPGSGTIGLCIGIGLMAFACYLKQTAIVYPVAWGLGEIAKRIRAPIAMREMAARLLGGAGIFIAVFALIGGYFAWRAGWKTFVYHFLIFNAHQWYPFSLFSTFVDIFVGVAPWMFLWSVFGIGIALVRKEPIPDSFLIAIPPVVAHCLRVPYHHYLIVALPFVALFAARGLKFLVADVRPSVLRTSLLAVSLIAFLPTVGRIGLACIRPFGLPPFADVLKRTPFMIGSFDRESVYWEKQASEKIKAELPANSGGFYTDFPLYYFYLDRQAPWNADLLADGIVSDPRFSTVDTILLHTLRGRSVPDQRPSFVPADFSERFIELENGQVGVVRLYQRPG